MKRHHDQEVQEFVQTKSIKSKTPSSVWVMMNHASGGTFAKRRGTEDQWHESANTCDENYVRQLCNKDIVERKKSLTLQGLHMLLGKELYEEFQGFDENGTIRAQYSWHVANTINSVLPPSHSSNFENGECLYEADKNFTMVQTQLQIPFVADHSPFCLTNESASFCAVNVSAVYAYVHGEIATLRMLPNEVVALIMDYAKPIFSVSSRHRKISSKWKAHKDMFCHIVIQ